jgi:hypothetical protein
MAEPAGQPVGLLQGEFEPRGVDPFSARSGLDQFFR